MRSNYIYPSYLAPVLLLPLVYNFVTTAVMNCREERSGLFQATQANSSHPTDFCATDTCEGYLSQFSIPGKMLLSHVMSSHSVTSPFDCGVLCTSHSSCKSFNYRPGETGQDAECELNAQTRDQQSLAAHAHYEYYHFVESDETLPVYSCVDLLRRGCKENGIYNITDKATGSLFKAYCDLSSEKYSAWTLVLSYSIKNKQWARFCSRSFDQNEPYNEASPNWDEYRMSLPRMQQLAAQSTHWRSTTGFPQYGVDYRDYLRGNFSVLDVMNFEGLAECKKVEYINIRGIEGRNIEVAFWQKDLHYMLFTHSSRPGSCQYNAALGSVADESNFNYYCNLQTNVNFRGTVDADSSTQWWFGSYL